jgi:hypothetical protein
VTFPGRDGRWIAKNIRHHLADGEFPAWHRSLIDLNRPNHVPLRLEENGGVSDVDAMAGGWRRLDRCRVAAGGAAFRPPISQGAASRQGLA